MLLKVFARVKKITESDLELEDLDLGTIVNKEPVEWVWREIAIPTEEVYRITAYSKSKTVIQLYDREKLLVNEPFSEVFSKWEKSLKSGKEEEKEEEYNEESENFNEEE